MILSTHFLATLKKEEEEKTQKRFSWIPYFLLSSKKEKEKEKEVN
jgi:hypothetical protein